MSPLPDFQAFNFTAEGSTRTVFHKGNGPAVVLMHELPGMIPGCITFAERFARLREEFGNHIELTEIDSSSGNPHGIRPKAHAVLTVDFVDQSGHPTRQALDRILETFRDRL